VNEFLNKDLVPDELLPTRFKWNGVKWIMFDSMQNYNYRVFALPYDSGAPRWFSNDEVIKILEKGDNNV